MPESSAPRTHRRTSLGAALAFALVWLVAMLAFFLSLLFPLGVPGCSPEWPSCDMPPVWFAYSATWGAIAIGIVLSFVDIVRHTRIRMAVQLSCSGLIALGALFGLLLMNS
ncbi:hypothetical protein ACFWPH_06650 [Nocardia sp. NPDC058499]|uniref:hypothetical protein n=1 Tax=Nocardia sp. NPDC058499 TaxID=3346530 RepID=UPI00364975A5